jgi:choice-of-anchor A domain-containing protein
MNRGSNLACGMAVVALAVSCSVVEAGVFSDWNLIVRNNLTGTSEVDGSAIVGGSIYGTMNYSVQGVTAPNNVSLAVGGNFPAGSIANINKGGNMHYGGTVAGIVNLNGGGTKIQDNSIGAHLDSLFRMAYAASAANAALPATGTLDNAGNLKTNAGDLLAIDGQKVAVYSLTSSQMTGLGQLNLNFGLADTVIINVAANANGVVNLTAPPNLIGGFSQNNASRILWNFYDAETLIVNNNLSGAVLAPDATLYLNGGGINGTVIVDEVAALNAEVRRHTYQGVLIPAPGAAALATLAGLVAFRRRR